MTQTIVYILICINVVTFLVYGIDKWKAKQGSWRISEATLLMLAVIGGTIGALLGMQVWRHKTMHKKFKYGLPLILLAQIALMIFAACAQGQSNDIVAEGETPVRVSDSCGSRNRPVILTQIITGV